MYFACDASHTRAVCGTLLETMATRSGLTWLALVDGAFDHGGADVPLPNERHALYDCDGMTDLLAASPFLVVLNAHDEDQLKRELAALLRHRKERPMLSFIGTSAPTSTVNENFRLFANAVTEDEQEFLLRFADTRVLPGLAAALRQTYWDGMTCMLSEWIYIGRDGKAQALPLSANRPPLKGPFRLSSAEFAMLVANSEPDAIMDAIAESNPEAFPDIPRIAIYHRVAAACSFAEKHDVQAFPDLVALTYLALLNEGRGLKDPKLSDMLLRSQWIAGSLVNDLISFID